MLRKDDRLSRTAAFGELSSTPPEYQDFSYPEAWGPVPEEPSLIETTKAMFTKDNASLTAGVEGALTLLMDDEHRRTDPTFFPLKDLEGTVYEPYADEFIDVPNEFQSNLKKEKIDRLIAADEVLQASGTVNWLVASLASGLVSPTSLLTFNPIGAAGKAGSSLLRIGTKSALQGGASIAAGEGVLQALQPTRTAEESALNIAGGVVLSGMLGAGAGAILKGLNKAQRRGLEKEVENLFTTKEDPMPGLSQALKYEAESGSTGAKKVNDTNLDDETLRNALGFITATKKLNPNLRLATSSILESRKAAQGLVENTLSFNKNKYFIPTDDAVESLRNLYDGMRFEAKVELHSQYKEYGKKINGGNMLDYKDFKQQVSKALIRGDKAIDGNEFVTKAAQNLRKTVFDPLKEKAIEAGLLPKDVKPETAISYLTRVWNKKAIIAEGPRLRGILQDWLQGEYVKATKAEIAKAQKEIDDFPKKLEADLKNVDKDIYILRNEHEKLKKQIDKYMKEGDLLPEAIAKKLRRYESKIAAQEKKKEKMRKEAEEKQADFAAEKNQTLDTTYDIGNNGAQYISEIIDNILANLKGYGDGGLRYDIPIAARGPLAERVLGIEDIKVEDFLVQDIEQIIDDYIRIMSADIEIKNKFGDVNMKDQFAAINAEAGAMAEKAATPKERKKIEDQRDADIKDLTTMLEITRGLYKGALDPDHIISRALQGARALNYVTLLGGQTISSTPDIANLVIKHGYGRLIKNLAVGAIVNPKGFKANVREAQRFGIGTETVLQGWVASAAEIMDPYGRGTAFSRMVHNMAKGFSKITGINIWNDIMQGSASVVAQQRILDNSIKLAKGKNLSKGETIFMASNGLSHTDSVRIAKAYEEFGSKEGLLKVANTKAWPQDLQRKYGVALGKSVNSTILKKGLGDVPLVFHSKAGQTIFQFKGFAMAAHNRILLAGLQDRDAAVLSGMVSAIAIGMGVTALKNQIAGRENPDTWQGWLVEGLDRSGLLSVIFEVNNMAEKLGVPGIGRLAGDGPVSRYANRNAGGAFLGPTIGLSQNISEVIRAIFTGDITKGDIHSFRQTIPAQNIFYLSWLFNLAEEGLASKLGAR